MFLNENQSNSVEQFSMAVNMQNNTAMYGSLTSRAWFTPKEEYTNSSGKARQIQGQDYENFLIKKLGGTGGFTAKAENTARKFDGSYGNKIWYEAKSGDFFGEGFSAAKFAKFKSDMGRGLAVAKGNRATYEFFNEKSIPPNVKNFLDSKGINYYENVTQSK